MVFASIFSITYYPLPLQKFHWRLQLDLTLVIFLSENINFQ